tara:strand:+ start:37617 stop:38225 length:609 start_codon:yes stop_codon:yes gene_type:complete
MNRYIKAMEIGLANEIEGISYFDLVKKIEDYHGKKMGDNEEATFYYWFLENFSRINEEITNLKTFKTDFSSFLKGRNLPKDTRLAGTIENRVRDIVDLLNLPYYLKGNAAKQYLDYLELTEARKQAKATSWFSIISIGIAVIAILIGVFNKNEIPQPPKPPYDVKIIEDNTKVKDLQNENDQLKEKLFKAEMMVRLLEDELK